MRGTAVLLVLAAGCSHGSATVDSTPPPAAATAQATPVGDPTAGPTVVGLSLPTYPQGPRHAFAEDQGHVVVVDAWATWCGPCVKSLPLLQALQQRFAAQGLRTYAVNVDSGPGEIPGFLAQVPITLPILLDPDAEVLEGSLDLRLMPTTYLVDRSGKIRARHEGFAGNVARLQADVERLLAEPR